MKGLTNEISISRRVHEFFHFIWQMITGIRTVLLGPVKMYKKCVVLFAFSAFAIGFWNGIFDYLNLALVFSVVGRLLCGLSALNYLRLESSSESSTVLIGRIPNICWLSKRNAIIAEQIDPSPFRATVLLLGIAENKLFFFLYKYYA